MIEQDLQDQKIDAYYSALGEVPVLQMRLPGYRTESGFEFEYIDIAYTTMGTLSENKDNAILVCHALSGNAHCAGINPETQRPGWWDFHVGPGKTIDTNQFFVICSNVVGGCNGSTGPASVNPKTGQRFGAGFPPVTIRDMVRAQAKLIDALGIDKLFSVVGGSMGGMQALVWATDYPARVHTCVPIATCMAHSAMQIAFNEVGRQAILTDPNWNGGNYYDSKRPEHGLAVARMVGHVTYLSEYSMRTKFGRKIQRPASPDDLFPKFYSIESYLQYQGESFVRRFDPNAYLYITKALDMFDLMGERPAIEVLGSVRARFLVVSFESDWLYPPSQSREMVKILKRSNITVSYCNLDTKYGHDSFLIQNPEFARVTGNFLTLEYQSLQKKAGLASVV